ncbi:Facilitated trehalose transporter Tret1 [Eumeta japonica]|uniref:Facilitated trehalose transporter Tret1 n=1 Tax=Eumeta variegata TaxID=151549 RepID=A0A4C1YRN1_EUMVA|nr:Facilitated trehalose transporter Tret1 [Eumeta japonica]
MYAWPSSIVNNFKSNETVLSHAMGPYEVALFGSLSSVGALVGTPLFGYLSDSIGRKYSCIAAGIPFLVAWSMIATFRQVEVVLVALFIAGFGAATGFISPVFVSEICQDSLRGVMTISTVIFYNSGILLSYLLGGHLSYYCFVYVQIIISALYIILANFLKDSPVHLMNKGRESEAATSIAFYRSVAPDSKEVLEELDNIKKTLNLESCGQTFPDSSEEAKLNQTPQPSNDEYVSPLRYLLKSQSSRRALAVCLMMITAANLMGMVVVLVYAEPIFEDAVPSMPATLCTIMLAVVMIVATVASASLVNRAGRKFFRNLRLRIRWSKNARLTNRQESCEDDPRPGRSVTVVTEENVRKIENLYWPTKE